MPRPVGHGRYKEVRGLSRGLDVLRALNLGVGGQLSLADVADITGLHRTTVRRLLETLAAHGYVRRSASDDSFRLALGVRTLSEGFTDDEWIAEAAAPLMGELLQEVVWPTDLCTPDGTAMVVRESTHRFSPFSFHRAMVGTRLPMLFTAAGRAYFAFCPEEERLGIVRLLRGGDAEEAVLARSPRALKALVERTRLLGYGTNDREWSKEPRFSAIAVPIRHGGAVRGSLNIIFAASALTVGEAAGKYLPALRRTVDRISAAIAGRHREGVSAPDHGGRVPESAVSGRQFGCSLTDRPVVGAVPSRRRGSTR